MRPQRSLALALAFGIAGLHLFHALRLLQPLYFGAVLMGWAGALFVTLRRPASPRRPGATAAMAGAALVVSGCAFAGPWREVYHPLDRFLPLASGVGLALLSGGATTLRRHARELALLALPAVEPPPALVIHAIAPAPQTAAAAGALLQAAGYPVTVQGTLLQLPSSTVEVTSQCAGVHAVAQLVSLGILALALFPASWRQRFAVGASAIAIALAVNVARVTIVTAIAARDPEALQFWEPPGAGSALFPIVTTVLGAIAWWAILRRGGGDAPQSGNPGWRPRPGTAP